jgi:hypothetical protein
MLPGRFLGIARTTGDALTFYILTQSEKGRDVVLTRSVVRKRLLGDLETFAEYPDQEERAEERHVANVNKPRLPTGTEEQKSSERANGAGSLVTMLFKRHDDGSRTLLKGDDSVYQAMIKKMEACEAEEIIIGDQRATYEGTDEDTGEVILYMEDGSYKNVSTEEIYNNMNKDYSNKEIVDLLEVRYSEADGKLYIKVKWHTGEETLIDALDLKADEPLRLANFLLENPVEKLRSGYWNDWAKKTAKNINCAIRRIRHMYAHTDTDDPCSIPFRNA